MNLLWVIIPVKSLQDTKSRLSAILTKQERSALTLHLLHHQLDILLPNPAINGILVVSRDDTVAKEAMARGCEVLVEDATHDLNKALVEARDRVAGTASHILILPSDLPRITAESVDTILGQRPLAAICSDRHGTGTNALLIPAKVPFPFAFGPHSFQHHLSLLTHYKIPHQPLYLPDIAFDLDTPADWNAWQQMIEQKEIKEH